MNQWSVHEARRSSDIGSVFVKYVPIRDVYVLWIPISPMWSDHQEWRRLETSTGTAAGQQAGDRDQRRRSRNTSRRRTQQPSDRRREDRHELERLPDSETDDEAEQRDVSPGSVLADTHDQKQPERGEQHLRRVEDVEVDRPPHEM